jgi:hypothetical protein
MWYLAILDASILMEKTVVMLDGNRMICLEWSCGLGHDG